MKKYQSIFFDLDHTLWDYDTNSRETLLELYADHKLDKLTSSGFEPFHDSFQNVNLKLWDKYDRGLIDREVIRNDRFKMVLADLGFNDDGLADQLGEHYLTLSPTKKNLVPNALEVLEYLHQRYPMYLVTNGFENMQSTKVLSGGIRKYFKEVVTSERAGHKKPAREIFDFTLALGGFNQSDVVMIGDNLLTDMAGATNAGIDTVYFNPKRAIHDSVVSHEISDLIELKQIL